MTAMTPDKVEAALASLKQLSAAIACPDLPRRTRADESRWAAKITDALSVLTEALAERDAGRDAKCDGALHPALWPHSKEWYCLCERRFYAERITISGQLAEAIVKAIACGCCKPTANLRAALSDLMVYVRDGEDLMKSEKLKNLDALSSAMEHNNCIRLVVAQAQAVLAESDK